MIMRRFKIDWMVIVVAIVLVLIGFVVWRWTAHAPTINPVPTVTPAASVTIEGKLVCLPHADQSGPQTLECAYGLQAEDGRYYGLSGDSVTSISMDVPVTVTGSLEPAGEDERYAISGTITVATITAND